MSALRGAGLARWAVSAPPMLYLLVLFAAPSLIMLLASFRSLERVN